MYLNAFFAFYIYSLCILLLLSCHSFLPENYAHETCFISLFPFSSWSNNSFGLRSLEIVGLLLVSMFNWEILNHKVNCNVGIVILVHCDFLDLHCLVHGWGWKGWGLLNYNFMVDMELVITHEFVPVYCAKLRMTYYPSVYLSYTMILSISRSFHNDVGF